MPAPEVTVILATYNSRSTLRCALRSLCQQSFQDFEAWVIGDGCTDHSEQIVAEFADSRLHWLNLPQRAGSQSAPNNEGLRRARGRYIAYLGHDDLWFPWHLAGVVTTIGQTAADFVHAVTALIDPTGVRQAIGAPGVNRSYAHRWVVTSSWLHRREMVESCGTWSSPEGQISGIDFVFQRRAFLTGHRFACCSQLSVVKFPSHWWRTYSLREGHPQAAYLTRMEQDPRRLHQQLLTELAFAYTRRDEDLPLWPSVIAAKWAIGRCVKERYGFDRWPLSQYLRFKHRRWRKRALALRGLPPPSDAD
jgi:hypothetical protein